MPERTDYRSPWEGELQKRVSRPENGEKKQNWSGWALLAPLVLAVGVLAFYLFVRPEGSSVSLGFIKPSQVLLGEPFELIVQFSNLSDTVLKEARLSLLLPDGTSFLGQLPSQRISEQSIGDLGPGSVGKQSFNLIATDISGSVRRIEAKMVYSSAGNSAQFEESAEADVFVGEPAVSLDMEVPESVFNGENFEVRISYANRTSEEFKDLKLKVDYPAFFSFVRSTVEPEGSGKNTWELGTLSPGSRGEITVTGSVLGPEKSFFNFNASLTSEFLGTIYTINAQTAASAVAQAPLSLEIRVNENTNYVAGAGERLFYRIAYKNNSEVLMRDVRISAQLIGEMFDFGTLTSEAVFNSVANTLTWLTANAPQLQVVAPGESGWVDFQLQLRNAFPIRRISDKNYTLKVQAQIESPTLPPGTAAPKTVSVANSEIKVRGQLGVEAYALWRDAESGILNIGPYPPKVNQPTQYTVHWRVRNYSTDAENIVLIAFLQSGARFTGQLKSNTDSIPTYNPNTGLVTWRLSSLPATKGIVSEPAEAVFQIEATPAITQLKRKMPLLGATKAEGMDVFTGEALQAEAPEVDTDLPNDPTITAGDRLVQP